MKNFFIKCWGVLRQSWLWSLLLVLLGALLVWCFGPLLAVDDQRFWASVSARLVSIGVLFLLWGLSRVFARWRRNRRRQDAANSGESPLLRARQVDISEAQASLRKRFKEALGILRTSSLYGGHSERWRSDLPWYLLIGPQGAGKTSLLEHSGLDFPLNKLERKLGRDDSGSAECDWYFGEYGVLIDTAGRFLEQGNAPVDGSAWATLLTLLRSRRRARPLNGVLVAVPVSHLQRTDLKGMETLGQLIRERLQEVHRHLHMDVPVYLLLTKADCVPGFDTYFDSLSREECEQVLGTSFTRAQCGSDIDVLNQQFDELVARLNAQVITRLQQDRDTQRRGLILDFPIQFARLGGNLAQLVDSAFTGNRYQRASQLRGFYFTSTAQRDAPVDNGTPLSPSTFTAGRRSRFIYNLFARVIFPEAELAGLDTRETRRINWRQRGLFAAALACLGLFGVAWANSFLANERSLETLRELAEQSSRQQAALTTHDDAALLPLLASRYAATQVFPATGDAALIERAGLYQGASSNPRLLQAYQRTLAQALLPRVAQGLEAQIRVSLGSREQLLGALRAYLMLGLPDRRDPAVLREWMAADWSRRHAGNTAVQSGLNEHFGRLLQQPFSYPLNDVLVAQARKVLRRESLATVVYRVLREQARGLPDYRLSQQLGARGALFEGSDYLIPGFYTQKGYQHYFITQGLSLVRDILQDNWVLGEGSSLSGLDMRRLLVELEQLYFADYANHWSEALNRLGLPAFADAQDGADRILGLTAANSPLLQLLVEVRENTRFPLNADSAALPAVAEQVAATLANAGKAAATAGKALSSKLPDTARKSLERRFEPLHRLLDDNNGPAADLVPALQALNDVQLQLAALSRASQPEQAAYELAKQRMAGQRDALSSLRVAAGRLPRPVSAWLSGLAEDAWMLVLFDGYRFLNQQYQTELYSFYDKALKQRYPFFAHSGSDVALNDFREFFKAQGLAERFFDSYLKPFVSGEAGHYRLRSVDGRSLPLSRSFLEQMSNAQTIRRSFFAENPNEPQVQFKLEPYTLDPGVSRAEFRLGNQQMVYRHGPITPMAFTWPTSAEDGRTSLVLQEQGGKALGIEKNSGAWSLFRLFDLMQTEYQTGRDVLMIKARVGGMQANYLVFSQRSPNPFDLSAVRGFRLPATL
ncbi:type VI secretion system membrane subunit TssM [Pseudomonas sp. SDI]|uniref:type VI secretion system membrane subunit TssM n=1 Tax=Pseudomonas sp. SDI TaxID=2170734 RepID=UPI000DE63B4C|nr:type VI secretion system membrane subunit TssM [Pseudomonas sp. SDI]PWB31960.1 type VI secretion system membrane subunit TssM [Pseudomonas sp. SDI]